MHPGQDCQTRFSRNSDKNGAKKEFAQKHHQKSRQRTAASLKNAGNDGEKNCWTGLAMWL